MEDRSAPNPDWVASEEKVYVIILCGPRQQKRRAVLNPEWLALEGRPHGVLCIDPSLRPYERITVGPPHAEANSDSAINTLSPWLQDVGEATISGKVIEVMNPPAN